MKLGGHAWKKDAGSNCQVRTVPNRFGHRMQRGYGGNRVGKDRRVESLENSERSMAWNLVPGGNLTRRGEKGRKGPGWALSGTESYGNVKGA